MQASTSLLTSHMKHKLCFPLYLRQQMFYFYFFYQLPQAIKNCAICRLFLFRHRQKKFFVDKAIHESCEPREHLKPAWAYQQALGYIKKQLLIRIFIS
jgi:hypothetical protein